MNKEEVRTLPDWTILLNTSSKVTESARPDANDTCEQLLRLITLTLRSMLRKLFCRLIVNISTKQTKQTKNVCKCTGSKIGMHCT